MTRDVQCSMAQQMVKKYRGKYLRTLNKNVSLLVLFYFVLFCHVYASIINYIYNSNAINQYILLIRTESAIWDHSYREKLKDDPTGLKPYVCTFREERAVESRISAKGSCDVVSVCLWKCTETSFVAFVITQEHLMPYAEKWGSNGHLYLGLMNRVSAWHFKNNFIKSTWHNWNNCMYTETVWKKRNQQLLDTQPLLVQCVVYPHILPCDSIAKDKIYNTLAVPFYCL